MYKKAKNKLVSLYRKIVCARKSRQEIFEDIYRDHIWGGGDKQFYSGGGSYTEEYVNPYIEFVKEFIDEHNISSVCDVGCGDFHVASQYVSEKIKYEGIDIVRGLIEYLNQNYATDKISFSCRDLVTDDLPNAELCLVRQVLQHLSNQEIKEFLMKIGKFKYVIITEHVYKKELAERYNCDKMHGHNVRAGMKSGIYLEEKPFCLPVKIVLRIPYSNENEEIISYLIENK